MTTLLASGMSLRGSTRRSKVSAIQVMSPCAPFGEPSGQTLARMRRRLGGRDPAGVEAERARLFA